MNYKITRTYDTLTPQLMRLSEGLGHSRRILGVIGRELMTMTLATFGPSGTGRPVIWADLKESYKRKLRARKFNAMEVPTLLRSGTLRGSLRLDVTDQHAEISSGNPYAAVHQFGDGPIPARPFLPMNEAGTGLTVEAESRVAAVARKEIAAMVGP